MPCVGLTRCELTIYSLSGQYTMQFSITKYIQRLFTFFFMIIHTGDYPNCIRSYSESVIIRPDPICKGRTLVIEESTSHIRLEASINGRTRLSRLPSAPPSVPPFALTLVVLPITLSSMPSIHLHASTCPLSVSIYTSGNCECRAHTLPYSLYARLPQGRTSACQLRAQQITTSP